MTIYYYSSIKGKENFGVGEVRLVCHPFEFLYWGEMMTASIAVLLLTATLIVGQEDVEIPVVGGVNKNISTEEFLKISGMAKVNFAPPGQEVVQSVNGSESIVPRNDSEGRSLELTLSNLKGKNREGRIINDPSKFSVQGFIPIVSIADQKRDDILDSNRDQLYPEQQVPLPSIAGIYEPEKIPQKPDDILGQFFDDDLLKKNPFQQGASAGSFVPGSHKINVPIYQENTAKHHISSVPFQPAHSIKRPTGKFIDNIEGTGLGLPSLGAENKCICVPFYMCKNGFVENFGRQNVGHNIGENIGVDERSARGLYNPYFSQENHTKAAETASSYRIINNNTAPSDLADYASDIMARFVGVPNNQGCGLLRRCCHLPPVISPVGSFPSIITGSYPQLPVLPENPHGKPFPPIVQKPLPPIDLHPVHKPFPKPIPGIIGGGHKPIPGFPLFPNPNIGLPKPTHPQPVYPGPHPGIGLHHHGTCGIRKAVGVQARVKNLQYYDDSAEFGEYPWHAAILKRVGPADSLYVCGGTLIAPNWVATAAHCIKKHGPEDLKVRLGEWDVHRGDEFYPYFEKYIADIIIHPEFYPGNLANDLALIKLASPIDLKLPHVTPACLPEKFESFAGKRCWVTGWGKNAFGHQGEYQSVLKEVDVPILNNHDCEHRLHQTRLGPYYKLSPGFVCAGGEPGKDACTGDGGSPLVCDVHGIWKVVGLVSWGIGCGLPGIPGVYVNMAHYRPWIESIIHRFG